MTKLNQELLEMIRNSDGHLTAEQAFLMAKEKNIKVSMASVYRILTKLNEEGYISKFTNQDKVDVFDKTTEDHEHLVCTKCGKVSDLHIKDFKKILIDECGVKNFDSYNLCINYICDECKKK